MEVCVLAKIVFLLSVIITSFDLCISGIHLSNILFDILFTLFLVFITNMYCEYWIAKGIVVFSILVAVLSIVVCVTKNEINKQIVTDEINKRTNSNVNV